MCQKRSRNVTQGTPSSWSTPSRVPTLWRWSTPGWRKSSLRGATSRQVELYFSNSKEWESSNKKQEEFFTLHYLAFTLHRYSSPGCSHHSCRQQDRPRGPPARDLCGGRERLVGSRFQTKQVGWQWREAGREKGKHLTVCGSPLSWSLNDNINLTCLELTFSSVPPSTVTTS